MGRGMMGPMGPVMMMRIIFSLMDSDGDGTISLPEYQAPHERIFKAMDANKDGRLTLEEMQAFMQGIAPEAHFLCSIYIAFPNIRAWGIRHAQAHQKTSSPLSPRQHIRADHPQSTTPT